MCRPDGLSGPSIIRSLDARHFRRLTPVDRPPDRIPICCQRQLMTVGASTTTAATVIRRTLP
jgi:hypothetical protein